jgi:hypothetical protein
VVPSDERVKLLDSVNVKVAFELPEATAVGSEVELGV